MNVRAALLSLFVVASLLTACNDDGRVLREPRPDQNASVSTLAPATTPTDGVGEPGPSLPIITTAPTITTAASITTAAPAAMPPVLAAPFTDGSPIDVRHTCEGADLSPALSWSAAPEGTVEIALTVVDIDAPGYAHWAMAGIDPLSTALGEGAVPEFAITSINGAGRPGYTGPCPPNGETHRYRYTVHFLLQQTELGDAAPGSDLLASIEGTALSSASITGTYVGGAGA